jgi:hypothetical protein
MLSPEAIEMIASGRHQMDALVRKYIHHNLEYRFMVTHDGQSAYSTEADIKSEAWGQGRPLDQNCISQNCTTIITTTAIFAIVSLRSGD